MAHKTADRRHKSSTEKQNCDSLNKMHESRKGSMESIDAKNVPDEEITERFVGVDETDRSASLTKIHILKTRSSSEQNLILKSSTLRKGNYLSLSLLNQKTDCDKLNNNSPVKEFTNQNVQQLDTPKSFAKSADCIKDLKDQSEDIPAKTKEEAEGQDHFKKNANVYSVFQGKTVLKERRRSLPTLPKLIGQKLYEHNQKTLAKSVDNSDVVAAITKDFREKTFRTLSKGIGRLLKRHSSVNISEPDPVFKVAYLGNVLTGWAKGEGCVDKPLTTLWRNYNQSSKPDVVMKLSITSSGLKGITKEHGLTEYWAHRITFCTSPPEFPKIFCWVYRHEGRKLKHELRCHAVLCSKESVSKRIATELQNRIHQALVEFKRDKIARQNARLSLANSVYENPSMPRRKILLSVGGNNYKPPLERSKSAPKLMAIEEMCSEEDDEEMTINGDNNKNTWTKDSTATKLCCKAEDIFPSYTLGRRKCDHKSPRKISLPETKSKPELEEPNKRHSSLDDNTISIDEVDNKTEIEKNVRTTNHVSFSFSNISENSEGLVLSDVQTDVEEDNEVFYCETDDLKKVQIQTNDDKCIVGQLCPQSNFIVLDSDEGSISSGCETASTVTSSDIEMNSLPLMQNDFKCCPEKVTVLERVQSFEQLFIRERDSIRSVRSSLKSNGSKSFDAAENVNETSSSPSDSACYSSSGETGPSSCSDEVNLVPLGEKNHLRTSGRSAYMRCSTYPPDDLVNQEEHDENLEDKDIDFKKMYKGDVDQTGDSDSACSVESGYSELESVNQGECIIGNTVMV